MTASLVRIRWGQKTSVIENYGQSELNKRMRFSVLEKRMKEWANAKKRPQELIIEIPHPFLKENNIELIDTPGTGSSWHEDYQRSLEEEIVNSKLRFAAIVVIVYRTLNSEIEAHERLIREVGTNNVSILAVCNLDFGWLGEFKKNRKNAKTLICSAEQILKSKANAICYRLVAEYSDRNYEGLDELKHLAYKEEGKNISDLRNDLVEILKDRQISIIKQATLESRKLVDELLQSTNNQIHNYEPVFNRIIDEQTRINDAITNVRYILKKGYSYNDSNDVLAVGTTIGTLATGALAAAGSALLTGGVAIPVIAIGAIVGAASGVSGSIAYNNHEEKKMRVQFHKQVEDKWSELQLILKNAQEIDISKILTTVTLETIQKSALFLEESQRESILIKLENEISNGLDKIDGYSIYRQNNNLDKELKILKGYLHRAS